MKELTYKLKTIFSDLKWLNLSYPARQQSNTETLTLSTIIHCWLPVGFAKYLPHWYTGAGL